MGLVHRDVSPENVILSFEGQTKVVDFGVAKAEMRGREETEPGLVKGKFLYFSPEQASARPLDGRSDVFAVGVMLYRMLCGVLPFTGQMHNVIFAIVEGRFRPALVVNPQLPLPLAEIVARALAIQRDQRYLSALAMGEALAAVLYGQEPTFSSETVKDWMTWLFAPELQDERRSVEPSSRLQTLLEKHARGAVEPPSSVDAATRRQRPPAPRSLKAAIFSGAGVVTLLAAGLGVAELVKPAPEEIIRAERAARAQAPVVKVANEDRVAQAYEAIEALNWPRAHQLLDSCVIGGRPCPEATDLTILMNQELGMRKAIENAEAALERGDLQRAKVELEAAESSRLLQGRYEVDLARLKTLTGCPLRSRRFRRPSCGGRSVRSLGPPGSPSRRRWAQVGPGVARRAPALLT